MAKQTTYRFNEQMDKWLEKQAKLKGCGKNEILRDLIYERMRNEVQAKDKLQTE